MKKHNPSNTIQDSPLTVVSKPYRQKSRKTARRRRVKLVKVSKLKGVLWELCKAIVRKRDGNVCFICLKTPLEGAGWHTGHFVPSSTCGLLLRFDLRNLHSSCYHCNINLGGNGAEFYRRLVREYGESFVDSIFKDKKMLSKATREFYEEKIRVYREISTWDQVKLLNYTRALGERTVRMDG